MGCVRAQEGGREGPEQLWVPTLHDTAQELLLPQRRGQEKFTNDFHLFLSSLIPQDSGNSKGEVLAFLNEKL